MKAGIYYTKTLKYIFTCLVIFTLAISVHPGYAQEPPHPPTVGHGSNGNQSPTGAARVGDGISILVAFALAYGYRKVKKWKTNLKIIENHES